MKTETISVAERDALYDLALSHLSGIDDLRIALDRRDFEAAARLGAEFGDDLRLLEDLGWGGYAGDEPITLTMPATQRKRLFARLRSVIERDEADIEAEARPQRQRASRIAEVCDRVLRDTASKHQSS